MAAESAPCWCNIVSCSVLHSWLDLLTVHPRKTDLSTSFYSLKLLNNSQPYGIRISLLCSWWMQREGLVLLRWLLQSYSLARYSAFFLCWITFFQYVPFLPICLYNALIRSRYFFNWIELGSTLSSIFQYNFLYCGCWFRVLPHLQSCGSWFRY